MIDKMFDKKIDDKKHDELAIELGDDGMVVVNDPELLALVSGGNVGGGDTGGGVGGNNHCGWHMM